MKPADKIRAAWLERLFSTEPADRARAEAAVRDLYAAASVPAPRYILWYDSPFEAAWAVAVLDAEQEDSPWRVILQRDARFPELRHKMESAREQLAARVGQSTWQDACAAIGNDFNPNDFNPSIFEVRRMLYPSIRDVQIACSFTAAEDDLFRTELRWIGGPTGVLGGQESYRPVSPLVTYSLRTMYPFSVIAADEAQAAGRTPPPLLAAFWEIGLACGSPWWAFENAVILTDRPVEIHVNDRLLVDRSDGPAVVYRDGACAWAVNGQAMPKEWVLHPERIPRTFIPAPPRKRVAKRVARRARKVKAAPGTYLKRYLAGEHEHVWRDLVALGADVRKPPVAREALEVARETMRRVAANVDTVARRLRRLKYEFHRDPVTPPDEDTPKWIRRIEKRAGPLPFSLRAFYEIVGAVDFIGDHDSISAESDPLVVFPLEAMLEEIFEGAIPIAPDHFHKANISGGAPYEIALPDPRADAELLNEPHRLFFVDYLRLVFRHGGFPGYAGMDRGVPPEIARLAKGLQPF